MRHFSCASCSAKLEYAPGTSVLQCPYCGSEQAIPEAEPETAAAAGEELDYHAALAAAETGEATREVLTVKCRSCGAESAVAENVTADRCPFCATPFVAQAQSRKTIPPRALLPFKVGRDQAGTAFRDWVRSLWFAPSALGREAAAGRVDGLYLPFWTYDCETSTDYRGQRGDDYTVSENYTTTENGRTVQRTRQVTKTRWTPVSGSVSCPFDDVLVPASRSLPHDYARALEPWDLESLVPFGEQYLSGFRVESYAVGLGDGFEAARKVMDERIQDVIRQDIGGDRQQVDGADTSYHDVTFKHVLLPVWLSSYRYGGRAYRFMVNARTGEVQGERPWSWAKIALAVFAALMVLIVLLAISGGD